MEDQIMNIGACQTAAAICYGVFQHDMENWSRESGISELYLEIATAAVFIENLYHLHENECPGGVFDYDVGEELGDFIGKSIEDGVFDCYTGNELIRAEATRLVDLFFV